MNFSPFLNVLVTNQYSAALNIYLQAGAVCSDFFTKVVPPDVYTDQVHHTSHSAVFIFFFTNLNINKYKSGFHIKGTTKYIAFFVSQYPL